ncbi:unnamed protein product [Didymodactylos carnosus]|uniref:ABC transporter domain-containing protein n=1 Tax=Didymodactylos carnosus TaxID=1234261 RepID=A0A813QLI4_9BILA|nr:unnamed protein product [Didymodactylos carnosus]CAF1341847.1 unnamed protein product [Didymodactylos carnosus]CAF3550633.1 unnamed protein product [Didymodactylos carnosus]CAF4152994.1 unnamed protein product [Didymodactylos carnosus]
MLANHSAVEIPIGRPTQVYNNRGSSKQPPSYNSVFKQKNRNQNPTDRPYYPDDEYFKDNDYPTKPTSDVEKDDKPKIPDFLRNSGPGLSPLKENPPVTLTWHGIRALAPSKQGKLSKKISSLLGKEIKEDKVLLKGVNGIVSPGHMCAIMGASGAGKTTLMNILTHRRPGKLLIESDVRINGQKMRRDISGLSGYVQQDELFIGSLSVREHLRFHSMLRLGKEFTLDERNRRVDEVIKFVENTTIGVPGIVKGLSGGEKRRLTVATEVLSDPPLLLCDEPTSGLDSSMAFILIQAMRKLADQGKTIVCTIHQPSSEIFYLFDTLYLLAEGRVAYFGSLEKAPAFFRSLNLEIPSNYNPADFYIQQLAIYPKTREENLAQIEYIADQYENSPQYARYLSEITEYHQDNQDENPNPLVRFFKGKMSDNKNASRYKTSSFTQFRWLTWRNFKNVLKNPFEIRLSIFLAIFIGLLIGILYIRLKYNQDGIQNINAVVFLVLITTSFMNLFHSYTSEFPIFYKEHDDAVYRVAPYYFSKFVAELPLFAITTLVEVCITYWMANLYATAKRFFIFAGVITLTSLTSVALGSVISVLATTPDQASAVQVPILLPIMIFGGFFLNNDSTPKWLIWIKYLSWFYYGNEILLINQWRDVKYLPCDNDNSANSNVPCYHNGQEVINYLNFDTKHYNRDIGLLVLLFVVLRVISFTALALKAKFFK